MKKVSFIGSYDNIDFVLYIAKLLTQMDKRVLLIDGTITQKAKYIVPSINPSKTYVTEFEGIDVAVGFYNYENIKQYLAVDYLDYDIALISVDTVEAVSNFDIESCDKNFFATSVDTYSLKRGLETLSGLFNPIEITKIFYSRDMSKEENDYLDFLALGYKVIWDEERVYLPFELGDQSVIYENQRVSKIKFKKLSSQYKEQLLYVTQKILKILDDENIVRLKKEFKKIEKGV